MKKLSTIARDFKHEELLDELETAEIKGGRRYVTKVYAYAVAVISLLKATGKTPEYSKHGDQYCIEW